MKRSFYRQSLPKTLWVLILGFVLYACQEESMESPDSTQRIHISDDVSALNSRIRVPRFEEPLSINDVEQPLLNGRQQNIVTYHETYSLLLRAEVEPPEISGKYLQASHVFIAGDLAFVSYNTKGPEYRGGIEVFDISNIESPSLIYQMVVQGTDYSSIYYENGKIYLAGAVEDIEDMGLDSHAILEMIDYPVNGASNSTIIDIPSFTATDVKVNGEKIYVSSGSHGGLNIFDKNTLEEITAIGMDDARSIAFNDTYFAVMQGTPARVKVYQIADLSYIGSYQVGGADIPESKSILSMSQDKIYVPVGRQGMKIIDLNDGSLLEHMELPELEGVEESAIVTNAVSVNQDKIFCANGAAGMYLSESQEEQTSLIGSVNFQSSTNYVESRGNVMFVATGLGGLKIIEIVEHDPEEGDYDTIGEWDQDGTPQYLCEQNATIASSLRGDMSEVFKGTKNLMERKPEYFSNTTVTDVQILQDTDLEVIFYGETAGYKNVMGYYVYDANNPPSSPDDLNNKTIVFPNTSRENSGGWLKRGDKVCIPGLKAGEVIGFFIISDGWKGKITEGIRTSYSTQNLNVDLPEQYRQTSVLLSVEEKDALVLGFEDIKLPGGDKDFDDALFIIQTSVPGSFDYGPITPL